MLSSANRAEMGEGQARQTAAALLGGAVADLSRVAGGGNNRLFQVAAADGALYALKSYLRDAADERDRLGVEFEAARFLWQHGVRQVPRAVARDEAGSSALYAWVDGERVVQPGEGDIDQAIAFLAELHSLAAMPEARRLPLASEACLSAGELVRQIIESRPHPEQGYRSCLGLLSLARRYDKQRLEDACARALKSGATSYRSVKSMLQHGLDQIGDEQTTLTLPAAHTNVRGADYYSTHNEGIES